MFGFRYLYLAHKVNYSKNKVNYEHKKVVMEGSFKLTPNKIGSSYKNRLISVIISCESYRFTSLPQLRNVSDKLLEHDQGSVVSFKEAISP